MSTIMHLKLNAGTLRGLAHPHVEVRMIALLKVDRVIAVLHVSQIIDQLEVFLHIQLDVFLAVREEVDEVTHEMPFSSSDSSGTYQQSPLLVHVSA